MAMCLIVELAVAGEVWPLPLLKVSHNLICDTRLGRIAPEKKGRALSTSTYCSLFRLDDAHVFDNMMHSGRFT